MRNQKSGVESSKKLLKRTLYLKIFLFLLPVLVMVLLLLMMMSVVGGLGSVAGGCDTEETEKGRTESGHVSNGSESGAVSEEQLDVAKKIAAVLTEYGLDKNKVYGAIGNAQQESSLISPFAELTNLWGYWKNANNKEEAIAEIQKYGTRAEDLFVGGWSGVLAAYGGVGLSEAGYQGGSPDGSHWVGFGIWQWTGYNGVKPYFDWADANNLQRANIDSILAFAVSDSSEFFKPYTAEGDFYFKRLEKIKNMPPASSPAEGATIWLDHYEYGGSAPRGGWVHLEQRIQYATNWAVRLEKEKLDESYAKSIISLANTASAQGNARKNEDGEDDCGEGGEGSGKGGHPFAEDYYWTAAFGRYSRNKGIADVNTGNQFHNGVDLVGSWEEGFGTPRQKNRGIHSVYDGTIVGVSPLFGQIFIKTDKSVTGFNDDVVLEYTHLLIDETFNKHKIGDTVKAGDLIANEGDTGSTGLTHLHFGVLNADVYASGADLWRTLPRDPSNYGSTTDAKIIDPSIVIEGIEVGWLDSTSNNYLGDEFLQPNPLRIRVDGTTAEDERVKAKLGGRK